MRAVLGSGACVESASSYRKYSFFGVGCAVGREFAPAGDLLFFAPPKKSRQKKGGPTFRGPAGNLRCSVVGRRCRTHFALTALRSNSGSESEHEARMLRCAPAPRPALLGTARGVVKSTRAIAALGPRTFGAAVLLPLPLGEAWPVLSLSKEGEGNPSDQVHRGQPPSPPSPSGGRGNTKAERSDGPNSTLAPSGCAEERSGRGARMQRSMHSLRAQTRCRCLSGESAANKASSAAALCPRAPQVARSEAKGRSQWGRLSFAYFSLAEQRKVGAPPGAHPGQQRDQKSLSEINTLAEPAASPSPQPSPQRGEGVKR